MHMTKSKAVRKKEKMWEENLQETSKFVKNELVRGSNLLVIKEVDSTHSQNTSVSHRMNKFELQYLSQNSLRNFGSQTTIV